MKLKYFLMACVLIYLSEHYTTGCNIQLINGSPARPEKFVSPEHVYCYLEALKRTIKHRYGKRMPPTVRNSEFLEKFTNAIEPEMTKPIEKNRRLIYWFPLFNKNEKLLV